jgi:hypothetical protein
VNWNLDRTGKRRAGWRVLAALGVATLASGLAPALAAQAAPAGAADPSTTSASGAGEVLGHPYRHGVVQTLGSGLPNLGLNNLRYGGGTSGVGVTTGAPKVYLVFWGSQWGTAGTDAKGNTTLSGDPQGTAPILQGFFKGLGTNAESWSGVMTQYCQGVASGATTCPSGSAHVGYPTGGALAGVWVDPSAPAPAQATGNQIGAEAVKAAGHFGNTTAAANRNVQYVVLSPTGTHPDGFNTTGSQFCAWHDYTGDTSLSGGVPASPYGPLAFTNEPYVTDMGSSCGANFVNSGPSGATDGVTIVEGHEYAETITDQFPAGGWTDLTGYENGDKCAWSFGAPLGSTAFGQYNQLIGTGKYFLQQEWSNATHACVLAGT